MANLTITGSRATGVLIVKTDPLRVVQISKAEMQNKASEIGKAYDALFDDVVKGVQQVFAIAGGDPVSEFSYSADMTEEQFNARRWRASPIAQAVGSVGQDAGAAEYAARRWRCVFASDTSDMASRRWRSAPAEVATRRWRAGADAAADPAAAGSADYSTRRWRAAVETEAVGDFAEFAANLWIKNPIANPSEAEFLEVVEYAVRRWRSMPTSTGKGDFDARRFRTAEEEAAAKETADYAVRRWRAAPDADALAEAEEFVARRWRSIDGILSGEAAKEGPIEPGLDP